MKSFGIDKGSEGILAKYIRDIKKYKPLTIGEEKTLAQRIHKGDKQALTHLIRSNLLFVVNVAHNYVNQGVPLMDLINTGNMGLMRAAKKFDETKNFKFISYAVWWIRQSILDSLYKQSRIVKLPMYRVAQLLNLRRTIEKIESKKHRAASPEELETILKIKKPQDLNNIMSLNGPHISLDSSTNSCSPLIECLEDEEATAEDIVDEEAEKEEIKKLLNMLTSVEKRVICEYYGIDTDRSKTLSDVGKKLNLTRERVRQIKVKALRKLKKYCKVQNIKEY